MASTWDFTDATIVVMVHGNYRHVQGARFYINSKSGMDKIGFVHLLLKSETWPWWLFVLQCAGPDMKAGEFN